MWATAAATQAAAVAARLAADESGAMELTERLAAEAQLSAIQAVADSGRAVDSSCRARLRVRGQSARGRAGQGTPRPGLRDGAPRQGLSGGAGGYAMGPS